MKRKYQKNRKVTNEDIRFFEKLFLNNTKIIEISKITNFKQSIIIRYLKDLINEKQKNKLLFIKSIEKQVCFDYQNNENINLKQLSIKYKTSPYIIKNILKRNNITIRPGGAKKYYIEANLLKTIDTEEKAYFLGLMYADGYIAKNSNSFVLNLKEEDKHILDEINLMLFKNKLPIYQSIRDRSNESKYKKGVYKSYSLIGGDRNFKNDLIKNGCFNNKSLTLDFPGFNIIPEYLFHHFIRGYFDGDGWIYFDNNKKNKKSGIISSDLFCQKLNIFLKNDIKIFSYLSKSGKVSKVTFSRWESLQRFYNYIYKDCKICLTRKRKKFEELFIYFNEVKNKKRFRKENMSGIYLLPNGKFRVRISINGIKINVGCFSNKEEAILKREEKLNSLSLIANI